jgi:ABC-type transport system involved in Fe-S cluster assembly fused permease/ATPase subunit
LTTPNREFANSTILTIAHRLRTVIDYDRVKKFKDHVVCALLMDYQVMLLDEGRIVEFDQ